MIERRNFYRILHVQPDAPIAVIRENYRIMMQKLKLHPDLGGPNGSASILNMAYTTLRDPIKRAAYDRELLKRFNIKTISRGAYGGYAHQKTDAQRSQWNTKLNQRNYYRVLQIQPDAPIQLIAASYQALKKNSPRNRALLDEAYKVLSNPLLREQYDAIFAGEFLGASDDVTQNEATQTQHAVTYTQNTAQSVVEFAGAPATTQFCSFCGTPYVPQTSAYHNENCLECASPLTSLPRPETQLSRRAMTRTHIRGKLMYYAFWPSQPCQGLFQDLSPTGVRFITNQALGSQDIIKIDAPNFQAVAEVRHKHPEGDGMSVGMRFVAVKFDQHQGNFISTQA